jgi:tRNA 2-thiouridine synthesizing protein E
MAGLEVHGVPVGLNDEGFLEQFDAWDEDVARALAEQIGIGELTDEHWTIIHYIRDYYREFQIAPLIRKLCKVTGVSRARLLQLFPSGPAKGACKVAGLPKPAGCI